MKFLIVDDDKISRKILTSILSDYAEIDIAVDGEEAIEVYDKAVYKGDHYPVICLDVKMPKKDGHAVLQHIRKMEAKMGDLLEKSRVLMTTSVSEREEVVKLLQERCDGYILKPYKREQLSKKLRQWGFTD